MEGNTKSCKSLGDVSFSYLREESLAVDLGGSTLSQRTQTRISLERKKTDQEGELGVFGAERYFNVLANDNKNSSHHSSSKLDVRGEKQRNRAPGTPSNCSEASWNSRTSLLQSNLTRNPSRNKKKKNFFATFGCSSCYDEKSVYVIGNEVDHHGKKNQERKLESAAKMSKQRFEKRSEDQHFAFPVLRSGSSAKPTHFELKTAQEDDELEVFGLKTRKGDEVAINLERKLSVLTWDAIPASKSNQNKIVSSKTNSGTGLVFEDMDSEASSDLFEIGNLAEKRENSTNQYEPSEGSLEWSVVTASAADLSGAVSGYDEKKIAVSKRMTSKVEGDKDCSYSSKAEVGK
ncbi:hypothetical protein UlMin_008235 [Ulmus minor]